MLLRLSKNISNIKLWIAFVSTSFIVFISLLYLSFTKQTVNTYAKWYDELNSWQWPNNFLFKPLFFDTMSHIRTYPEKRKIVIAANKYCLTASLSNALRSLTTEKDRLRYHHITNLEKTEDEFVEWWKDNR